MRVESAFKALIIVCCDVEKY